MTDETRSARDHIEGTVRRVLLQYAHLKHLLDTGASAIRLDAFSKARDSSQIVRCWVLTVGVLLSAVDRDMRVHGASRAVARRLVLNTSWLAIAQGLTLSVEGTKEVVTLATARIYAEIVGRGISEDYEQSAA